MDLNSYITGLVDGEGSFLVSFNLRRRRKFGVEPRPSFCLSLSRHDYKLLEEVRNFFNCGAIRFNKGDNTYKYETRSLKDLVTKIIPHFQRYPLKSSKQNSFILFREICQLMRKNLHLNYQGLIKIIDLAYQMNNFGARKYKKEYLLKIVNKRKV